MAGQLFHVAADVYKDSATAAWRMFYYNRADCEKPAKYAGLWSHGPAHLGKNQSLEARVYEWSGRPHPEPTGTKILDPTARDVRGGWWDAGDFNKYMGNTASVHNAMLLAAEVFGDAAKDNVANIPESGNGIPDLLDEVRYGTEFLLRMADQTGSAFSKCHELGASPPDSCKDPVMLNVQTSAATMNRLSALAFAALVWKERNLDAVFVKRCQQEAVKAWKLLEDKPFPWPKDPKDPRKQAYVGEMGFGDYEYFRAMGALCLFRLTGEEKYHQVLKDALGKWKGAGPGEGREWYDLVWVYVHTAGAGQTLVSKGKQWVLAGADGALRMCGSNRGYAAGIRGYWWGSNALVGGMGVNLILAAEFSADQAAGQRYLQGAEEYIHYLHGRNPLGLCYLTNMKQYGAEHSAMVMFHSWLGNANSKEGQKHVGEGLEKIGPAPGFVVGGVNGGMKRYVDNLDWRQKPWEFSEPDIAYQAPCATLLGYFAWKVQ